MATMALGINVSAPPYPGFLGVEYFVSAQRVRSTRSRCQDELADGSRAPEHDGIVFFETILTFLSTITATIVFCIVRIIGVIRTLE